MSYTTQQISQDANGTTYAVLDSNGKQVGTNYTPTLSPEQQNATTLQQRALNALQANANFLAIAAPNNAQTLAQVQTLTKECNGIIRLLLQQFDSTAGTS